MRTLWQIFISSILCFSLWAGGLLWFTTQIPSVSEQGLKADVIIVLTGDAGRLPYGLELLAKKRAKVAFISGAGKKVTRADVIRQSSKQTQKTLFAMKKPPVFLGNKARNTIGNAQEVMRWLSDKPYKTIILVTSSYHMPRSLSEFREVLTDKTIIPAPAFSPGFKLNEWRKDKKTQHLTLREYHKYIVSKLRHWFVSATRSS